MKNYYELLGVTKNMTCEEIQALFDGDDYTLNIKEQRALDVLTDSRKRQAYDNIEIQECDDNVKQFYHEENQKYYEELFLNDVNNDADIEIETGSGDVVVPVNSKEKFYKTLRGRIAIVATAAIVLVGGYFLLKPKGNSENPVNNATNVTATPTPGFKPQQKPEATPTPEAAPEQKPEEQPVVINPEEVTEINSENIDVMTDYYTEQAALKGLEVNKEEVRATLLIANKDSISKEEMEKMVPGLDLVAEYNKANNYYCAVNSHNIANCVYGKDMTKYISISGLCYSEGAHIVKSLEAVNVYLTESMNRETLTEDEFKTIFKAVAGFYAETSNLQVGQFEYGYGDLTAGGRYTAEVAIWPQFAVAFTVSDYGTDEILNGIDALGKVAIRGHRYLYDLTTYDKVNVK